jgi:hypothetical protein
MTYAWIIDTDSQPDHSEAQGTNSNAVGMVGPKAAAPELVRRLKMGEGHKFRLLDGDDEVTYTGRFIGDERSQDAFGPLDDFGMPNAGCTTIEYRNINGKFEAL